MPPISRSNASPGVALISNTLWYLLTFRKRTILALIARGQRVLCIGQKGPAARALSERGCEVSELDWRLDSMNPIHESAILARVTARLMSFKPRLVFSFTIKANLIASIASRLLGVPYCTNVSGLGTAFLRDGLLHRGVRRLFGFANAGAHTTFFQNTTDLALFESMRISTGRRTRVIPGSGVDLNYFNYEPPRERVRSFLMIARLIRDKGVLEYARAVQILKETDPTLEFSLAGPAGVQNVGALSVRDIEGFGVQYLGELDDVRPALRASDCVVLPSYREGMPKVILEAASMGRIAIVTDVPGCRDAITLETGIVCEPRSSESLAAAMRRATSLEPAAIEAMSRAARHLAETRFSDVKCTEPYLAIADAILSSRHNGD